MDYNQKVLECEHIDKQKYESDFLSHIGCKIGNRTTKGNANKSKSTNFS